MRTPETGACDGLEPRSVTRFGIEAGQSSGAPASLASHMATRPGVAIRIGLYAPAGTREPGPRGSHREKLGSTAKPGRSPGPGRRRQGLPCCRLHPAPARAAAQREEPVAADRRAHGKRRQADAHFGNSGWVKRQLCEVKLTMTSRPLVRLYERPLPPAATGSSRPNPACRGVEKRSLPAPSLRLLTFRSRSRIHPHDSNVFRGHVFDPGRSGARWIEGTTH